MFRKINSHILSPLFPALNNVTPLFTDTKIQHLITPKKTPIKIERNTKNRMTRSNKHSGLSEIIDGLGKKNEC